jgi:hypothetical protein
MRTVHPWTNERRFYTYIFWHRSTPIYVGAGVATFANDLRVTNVTDSVTNVTPSATGSAESKQRRADVAAAAAAAGGVTCTGNDAALGRFLRWAFSALTDPAPSSTYGTLVDTCEPGRRR